MAQTLRLKPDIKNNVKAVALVEGISENELINIAVNSFLSTYMGTIEYATKCDEYLERQKEMLQ